MGLRGSSWFRCDECRKLSLFTVREQNRAGRIRCTGCGSARLTVSAEGAAKQATARAMVVALQERHESLIRVPV